MGLVRVNSRRLGNRGESTVTELLMRNKQRQKHHKKDQTTANRMTVFFFFTKNRDMANHGESNVGVVFF